jgi:hypothetical protein
MCSTQVAFLILKQPEKMNEKQPSLFGGNLSIEEKDL